jgi:hypothetical protein
MNKSKYKKRTRIPSYYKFAAYFLFIVVIIGSLLGLLRYYQAAIIKMTNKPLQNAEVTVTNQAKKPIPTVALPASKNLVVPYASQAPFGNWKVHEESCEEAALLMYHDFLDGTVNPSGKISDTNADSVYRTMKTWQVAHYGKEADLTMEALGKLATEYYGFKFKTAEANEDNIKRAIADGSPVIVPVMTHSLLNNMYGPYTVYHVLLIKGYDAAGVITNDAGVGNGADHHYDWAVLFSAIDAQTEKMGQGRVMLTLSK